MNNLLSDFNAPRYRPVITGRYRYSDLDFSLRRRPVTELSSPVSDIFLLTDIDAVKNSIRNLVLSEIYDRPFQPELGTRISSSLFENGNPLLYDIIKSDIENVIRQYEPRISKITADVADTLDQNALRVNIYFVLNNDLPSEMEFIINRVR